MTAAEMLECQFRKASARQHVHNVTLRPTYSHPTIPVGEEPVAEVIDRQGRGILFTNSGLTMPGRGFVQYADIKRVVWMGHDRDLRRKQDEYDRIELEFVDGTFAKLVDLDQAVFPLLKFFGWLVARQSPPQAP